jgi:hypothetical protein
VEQNRIGIESTALGGCSQTMGFGGEENKNI